jgi:hypothetical protein
MHPDETCLPLNAYAAAVQVVEPLASLLEGRGHRWNLEEVAREGWERVAQGFFRREGGVQVGDMAFCVERIRDGTEAGCGRIGLVEVSHVARETRCAPEKEHEKA